MCYAHMVHGAAWSTTVKRGGCQARGATRGVAGVRGATEGGPVSGGGDHPRGADNGPKGEEPGEQGPREGRCRRGATLGEPVVDCKAERGGADRGFPRKGACRSAVGQSGVEVLRLSRGRCRAKGAGGVERGSGRRGGPH